MPPTSRHRHRPPGMKSRASSDRILLRQDRHPGKQLGLELIRRDHGSEGEHLLPVDVHVLGRHVQPTVVPEYLGGGGGGGDGGHDQRNARTAGGPHTGLTGAM